MTTTELIEGVRQLCADVDKQALHIAALDRYIVALEAELRVLRGGAAKQTEPKPCEQAADADNAAPPQ